jgi:cobalt-zinc-cadmium efflux system outer membrane protein
MLSKNASRPLMVLLLLSRPAVGQKVLSWAEVRDQFEAANPTLQAGRIGIGESRAQEITAHLRPNPDVTGTLDQLNPFKSYQSQTGAEVYRPFGNALPLFSASYLYERQHKRDLRYESARQATTIAESQQADLERTLLFNLRSAFVQTLQAKAALNINRESLAYYDRVLAVSDERFKAGDIARIDLTRLQLQRIQFLTDVQTAEVNLRTAKIQLLGLLSDRTPLDQFDVTGPFDFREQLLTLDELHNAALASRPDLRAAVQAIEKANTDHRLAVANGSTDPIFGVDLARNPPIPVYVGFSVTIPLRIFDRNQGEKARTQLEINRTAKLRDAESVQVYSDVDSAFATLNSNLTLLRPYKSAYLQQAADVRDTVSFAYQRGGASLLDFLSAQNDYRSIQLNYLNLVGAYLLSASQLNLAVGREVIQ